MGRLIGQLMQRQTSFVVGTVYAADEDVIVIEAFSFISSTGGKCAQTIKMIKSL